MRSVALGFWIGTGSAAEPPSEAGLVAPARAHAVPRHRALRLAGDRPDLRRHGRRAQRRHRQGDRPRSTRACSTAPRARVRRHGRHGLAPARSTSADARAASARSCSRRSRCTRTTRRTRSSTCSARRSSATTRSAAPSSARARRRRARAGADALRAFHAARYVPAELVVAAAGSVDHDALVALVERAQASSAPARRAPAPPAPPAAPAPPRRRFFAKDTEQYHVVPRRARASRATTSAASRCACSTRSSAARRPRGCSRRCARSAAWPTASYSFHVALRRRRAGRPVPRHAPRQRRHARCSVVGRRARAPAARTASPPRSSSAPRRTSRAAWCWRSSRRRRG